MTKYIKKELICQEQKMCEEYEKKPNMAIGELTPYEKLLKIKK